jgi:N-acetylmuramoyl-L-alanine amidase
MSNRRPVIVIDPGHGGSQRIGGSSPNKAVGPNGLLEKNLTLDLARRIERALSEVADVTLTRTRDINLALADRARMARDRRADLFLSLHLNGVPDSQVDGTEVWVARQANQQSRRFAQTLLTHLLGVTNVRDRGVRESDLGVLLPGQHDARTAACLAEVAFLTNPAQACRLTDEGYKQRIAEAIAAAVRAHVRAHITAEQAWGEALDTPPTPSNGAWCAVVASVECRRMESHCPPDARRCPQQVR